MCQTRGCCLGRWDNYLDLVVLHLVLNRSEEDTLFVTLSDLECLCELDHGIAEFVVDGLMHVDALDSQADLAGVEECKGGNLAYQLQIRRCGFGKVLTF